MCGIAGVINKNGVGIREREEVALFNRAQKHRGPDDEGIFHDDTCVLGHVRLSIIDLSSDGHQPFSSHDGRYQITYNGEIYNYIELRHELELGGHRFRTKTDTEVLLASYIAYGPACLSKLNGMFAFAIYDTKKKELFVARDRFGVKPFYYLLHDGAFYFASEIKALRKLQGVPFAVNEQALFDYLVFNRTDIFDETFDLRIKRLPKGYYGYIDVSGLRMTQWWDPSKFARETSHKNELEIAKEVELIMCSAVKLRMRSDVPVGSSLSGGLDSSTIVGMTYAECKPDHYETFTATFPGFALDETAYVEELNKKYPFTNHRAYPTAQSALAHVHEFTRMMDEPLTSPTFYSQYEVMRLAREHNVTVLLDGQGGDENFAGYHYFHGFYWTGLWRKGRYLRLAREILMSILRRQDNEAFATFAFQIFPTSLKKFLLRRSLPHIHSDFFKRHIERSRIYQEFFAAESLNESIVNHFKFKLEHLLRAEDRNSMAFHVEARLPYLDYRLVEFMLSVPAERKITHGENKLLQKKALGKYTIPEILSRKDKIGFGTPGEEWMRTPEWKKFTEENYAYCRETFPHIFHPEARLKYDLYERWKINQIALWHKQNYAHG